MQKRVYKKMASEFKKQMVYLCQVIHISDNSTNQYDDSVQTKKGSKSQNKTISGTLVGLKSK
jgi:hypothetical protein